jgi:hypothetical protein
MAEMTRKQNDNESANQSRNAQSDTGMGANRDIDDGQSSNPEWHGDERRIGAERRQPDPSMQMTEGSSR